MSPKKRKHNKESPKDTQTQTPHCSKAIKLSPNESPRKTTRNDTTNGNDSLTDLMNKIIDILGKIYFNSKERLHIDYVPKCMENLEYCSKNHFKNGLNLNEVDQYFITQAEQFIANDSLVLFIRFISNLIIRNRFPGPKIMLLMIEMILVSTYTVILKHKQFYIFLFIVSKYRM